MDKVLITGINGQLGSYLTDLYLERGWNVEGLIRRSSTNTLSRLKNVKDKITLHEGDITDIASLYKILNKANPDLLISCAAQSHVLTSFNEPQHTFDVTFGGVLNLLELLRNNFPSIKLIQLSSSEQFGQNYTIEYNSIDDLRGKTNGYEHDDNGLGYFVNKFQYEKTRMWGNSPYAVAKLAAHNMIDIYRKSYSLSLSCAICFNFEGENRGENFVTRKITKYIGNLIRKLNTCRGSEKRIKLQLGNINSYRDWSYGRDTAEAIYLIGEHQESDDFVICSGETHTIKDFLEEAFSLVNLNWQDWVEIDETLKRPCEVPFLKGYAGKIKDKLGWVPKTSFKELVKLMVEADLNG